MRQHRLSVTFSRCPACLSGPFDTDREMDAHHRAAQDRFRRTFGTGPGVYLPRIVKSRRPKGVRK